MTTKQTQMQMQMQTHASALLLGALTTVPACAGGVSCVYRASGVQCHRRMALHLQTMGHWPPAPPPPLPPPLLPRHSHHPVIPATPNTVLHVHVVCYNHTKFPLLSLIDYFDHACWHLHHCLRWRHHHCHRHLTTRKMQIAAEYWCEQALLLVTYGCLWLHWRYVMYAVTSPCLANESETRRVVSCRVSPWFLY